MRVLPVIAALTLAVFVGGAVAPSPPADSDDSRMSAADPCSALNARTINGYQAMLKDALDVASRDARANGTSGAYAVAATNSRDLLQRAYDRATQMVQANQKSNPNSTTYAEAGQFKVYLQTILTWLPDAAHWATISAAYHRSQEAAETFDKTTAAMERGSQLIGEAGRCYTGPYLTGAARAG